MKFTRLLLAATAYLCSGLTQGPAAGGKDPIIPYFDNVRNRFQPTGDSAWLKTGFWEGDAAITVSDITADGSIIFLGDADGNVTALETASLRVLWKVPVIPGRQAVSILKTNPEGGHILVAKTPGQNEFSHTYLLQNTGEAAEITDMGEQEVYNPACSATKMDPSAFAWSDDGATFFIMYRTHALANFDSCQVAKEIYIFFNNLDKGISGVKNIVLDAFAKPEQDEPDKIWCHKMIRLAALHDNKSVATSFCNSRILVWQITGDKLKLRFQSKSILYQLRASGFDPVGGSGYMHVNKKGEIYLGMGEPGAMSKSSIVKLSPNLKKMELLAYMHMPYPLLFADAGEKYMVAGSNILFIFNLKSRKTEMWGPLGLYNGQAALMHPTKRVIFLPEHKKLFFVVNRPAVKMTSGSEWQSSGRYLRPGDGLWLGGEDKARIHAGFGDWLREDYKYGNSWLDDAATEIPEEQKSQANEFKIRAAGEEKSFTIYGGRSENELENSALLNAQPGW